MKTLLLLFLLAVTACSTSREKASPVVSGPEHTTHAQHANHNGLNEPLPLFEGLSDYNHTISTKSPEAQRYFNQGMMLAYAFNHAQAKRSFIEAAKRDPQCAMCYWGAALVLGPNINASMTPEAEVEAMGYLKEAQARLANTNPQEKAYIQALNTRYAAPAGQNREKRDRAYADAMNKLAKNFPQDPDASTLAAEAMMDQHPWNYWTKTGKPQPWANQIVSLLENTIQRFPDHAGAHHLYIHAMEASPSPAKAAASADRLKTLVPAAGHLVHMPGHIYIRVGRYQEAIDSNLAAIEADKRQVAQSPGIYNMMYKPHNHHFLWAAATLAGQENLAKSAAESVRTHFKSHSMPNDPTMSIMRQHYEQTPFFDDVRFGRWTAILNRPMPSEKDVYARAIQHYARGIALAKTGDTQNSLKELQALDQIRSQAELKNATFMNNKVPDLLEIASRVATAERASMMGDHKSAITLLESACRIEDGLVYDEPADWHHPVRQILGRVYLQAKQPQMAERVYLEDLKIYPKNVWSTTGLAEAYEAEGKTQLATDIRKQLGTLNLPGSSF